MDWSWDERPIYESARIRMDGTHSPVVVYTFKAPRLVSDEEVQLMLNVADLHLERGLPYIALIALRRGSGIIGPQQRRMFAEWLDEHREALAREDFCTVIVVPEAIFRAGLRVVYRFRNPPIRTITASDEKDAVTAVRQEMARMRKSIGPELEAALEAFAS